MGGLRSRAFIGATSGFITSGGTFGGMVTGGLSGALFGGSPQKNEKRMSAWNRKLPKRQARIRRKALKAYKKGNKALGDQLMRHPYLDPNYKPFKLRYQGAPHLRTVLAGGMAGALVPHPLHAGLLGQGIDYLGKHRHGALFSALSPHATVGF